MGEDRVNELFCRENVEKIIVPDIVKVDLLSIIEEKLKKACDKLKNTKYYTLDIEKTELINKNIRNITILPLRMIGIDSSPVTIIADIE